jgi:hypothetical protein
MENWNKCFVPECFFDTVLFRKILNTGKPLNHSKGCFNVVNRFRNVNGKKGDLYDSPFGVGMVDKDKQELDYLRNECMVLCEFDNLLLWKHQERNHYIIQLHPPLEAWIILVATRAGFSVEDFGYSDDPKKLKKQIKGDIDKENDQKLNALVSAVLKSEDQAVVKLKAILLHLREKNSNTNAEELKAILIN